MTRETRWHLNIQRRISQELAYFFYSFIDWNVHKLLELILQLARLIVSDRKPLWAHFVLNQSWMLIRGMFLPMIDPTMTVIPFRRLILAFNVTSPPSLLSLMLSFSLPFSPLALEVFRDVGLFSLSPSIVELCLSILFPYPLLGNKLQWSSVHEIERTTQWTNELSPHW